MKFETIVKIMWKSKDKHYKILTLKDLIQLDTIEYKQSFKLLEITETIIRSFSILTLSDCYCSLTNLIKKKEPNPYDLNII